jgi:hypothetical protein
MICKCKPINMKFGHNGCITTKVIICDCEAGQ